MKKKQYTARERQNYHFLRQNDKNASEKQREYSLVFTRSASRKKDILNERYHEENIKDMIIDFRTKDHDECLALQNILKNDTDPLRRAVLNGLQCAEELEDNRRDEIQQRNEARDKTKREEFRQQKEERKRERKSGFFRP
ncbi:MAG: hypothetical protein FWE22_08615 [Firmicutes bacterium]|nr:hypothetical protein [Bacillota bacterium]